MPKQPKELMELLKQKNHHDRKATVHRQRYEHHKERALEVNKQLNALAESRREEG